MNAWSYDVIVSTFLVLRVMLLPVKNQFRRCSIPLPYGG